MNTPQPTWIEQKIAALFAHRMSLWLYVSIALAVLIWYLAPHMVKVGVVKISLITVAGYLGYFIGRALEKGIRPHELLGMSLESRASGDNERAWQLEQLAHATYQRRTWIVAACMIAVALGA